MSAETDRGSVVVTGTSTGIGAATAKHLAESGFHVFAGVRREEDGQTLVAETSGEVTPIIIEVADPETISAAVSTVGDTVGDRGLAGLVNNAGIAKPAPLEFQPMADFRTQLEVNLFGPVAMIQAFLPLVRRGHGRIVNVGSIGGKVALPLNAAYSASKFGMRGSPTRFGSSCGSGTSTSRSSRSRPSIPRSSARRTPSWTGSNRSWAKASTSCTRTRSPVSAASRRRRRPTPIPRRSSPRR